MPQKEIGKVKHHLQNYPNFIQKSFELLIFVGCLIFVIVQGTQCIKKFLEKPEAVTTIYDFASKYPFPEITICPQPFNQFYPDDYPKLFNESVLEKCGLTWQEYKNNAKVCSVLD